MANALDMPAQYRTVFQDVFYINRIDPNLMLGINTERYCSEDEYDGAWVILNALSGYVRTLMVAAKNDCKYDDNDPDPEALIRIVDGRLPSLINTIAVERSQEWLTTLYSEFKQVLHKTYNLRAAAESNRAFSQTSIEETKLFYGPELWSLMVRMAHLEYHIGDPCDVDADNFNALWLGQSGERHVEGEIQYDDVTGRLII